MWQQAQDAAVAEAVKAVAEVKEPSSDTAKDLKARVKLLEVLFLSHTNPAFACPGHLSSTCEWGVLKGVFTCVCGGGAGC